MLLAELIRSCDRQTVFDFISRRNENEKANVEANGYADVWDRLLSMQPVLSPTKICFEKFEWGHHTYGVEPDSDESWSLSLVPWEQWLGMEVDLTGLSNEVALGEIMIDMTFHGFEPEDITDVGNSLTDMIDEITEGRARLSGTDFETLMRELGVEEDDLDLDGPDLDGPPPVILKIQ